VNAVLVGITRVLNEDDIVEAFVRHHATMVDHHVFVDNGSTDETIAILRALKDEGLNISVFHMNLVEDPLPYLGGPLRYTRIVDPRFKAIRVLAAFAEQLAQAHAHFIDTNQGVKLQAVQSTYVWEQLF
jgi:hypothetical protein